MAPETMTLDYYRVLPYKKRVNRAEEEGVHYFVAHIEEMPNCFATGDTRQEALMNLANAFDDTVTAFLELDREIPEPAHGRNRFAEVIPAASDTPPKKVRWIGTLGKREVIFNEPIAKPDPWEAEPMSEGSLVPV